ncbi:uncharacterized protein LOC141614093 [Silene latifolia]|uniref:uncharacterized protein LOC141614093 n=1 Tax=Silene latifolia TaxID=37657 RepID=UPI003D7798B3
MGLPLFNARLANDMYQPLLDKIKAKVTHWTNHCLRYAGKATLINSVIFGLNNFWGASVLLRKGVVKKITKLCKDFVWGIEEGSRRHVFMGWKSLSKPRQAGGIGIKEVLSWNGAQMVHWLWKLVNRPESIWAKWVHHYILKGTDFCLASTSVSHSWYWNNVVKVKDFLVTREGSQSLATKWILDCTKHGKFKAGMMYELIRDSYDLVHWAPLVFDKAVVPKHSFMGMMALQNSLPTIDNLTLRGLPLVNRCLLCCSQGEDLEHLFFSCPFSSLVWHKISSWLQVPYSADLAQVVNWFQAFLKGKDHISCGKRAGFLATLYYIWNERNARVFKGTMSSSEAICIKIKFVTRCRMY